MKSARSPSLLLLVASLQSAEARDYTRRRLANREPPTPQVHEDASSSDHSFYDFSLLDQREKLDMIKTAVTMTKLGDSVDWDDRRAKFREAVWNDWGGGRSSASGDEAIRESSADQSETRRRPSTARRLQKSIDGDVFEAYEYSKGKCPGAGSLGVPCAPDNISELCNKYNRESGSFKACFEACGPAFCCVHDADRELNYLAPNCNTDENCPGYNWCYIAWWKMHDTIGPALFLRLEQDDDFYDIKAADQETDVTSDPVFNQILLHHFDDVAKIVEAGTVDNEFNADRIFLDPTYWDTDI